MKFRREPNSETLLSEEVDNLGKTTAVSKDFSVKAKEGWKVKNTAIHTTR